MARYMKPTTNIDHILHKLSVIFGTVASFDVLLQNVYKVSQGNNKGVPSFAMRLEGTLHQIQLQCPGRMTDLEAQQHLRDCLFHGVRKHTHDSIQYLYNSPSISYSQVMIAAHKVENENEETWDWIRMRAVVATVEGMAGLQHQIAQLMTALTQTRHGNSDTSTLGSPWECCHRQGSSRGGNNSHPDSYNDRSCPCQMSQDHSLPTGYVGEDMGRRSSKQGK